MLAIFVTVRLSFSAVDFLERVAKVAHEGREGALRGCWARDKKKKVGCAGGGYISAK